MIKHVLFLFFLFHSLWMYGQWNVSVLPGEPSIRALDASGSHNIWISGSQGSILVTTDGGQTWTNRCPDEFRHLDFRGLAVLSDSVVLAMSAGDASEGRAVVIKTTDHGKTWKKVVEKSQKGIFFDTIKFRSPWTGYLLGDPIDAYPYLLKTIDGGETWARVTNLPEITAGEASFAASNSCITTSGDNVWFHTQNRIFHSFNSGEYWQVHNTLFMKGASQGIFGIFAIDPYTLIAVGGDYQPHKEPVLQYAHSGSGGQAWYTSREYWKIGLTECIGVYGPNRHLISVGTQGTGISRDSGFTWKSLDTESFHVVRCFGSTCLAAGANGRAGIIYLE